MTFSFFFPSISIFSVIMYQLRIFEGLCLILWAKSMKNKGNRSQNITSLFVMGVIFTIFSGLTLWLPGIRLSGIPTDAERFLFYTISMFYSNSQPALLIIIGFFLLQYLRQNFDRNDNKTLVGPLLFITGYGVTIIFDFFVRFIWIFAPSLYSDMYELIIIGFILTHTTILLGMIFLFLYFIYINHEFIILFGAINLALIIVNLFSFINYLSISISYYFSSP